jgi:hypothetical protein
VCVGSWSQLFLLKFNLRDDDDEFLYGDSELKESSLSKISADLIVAPEPSAGETPLPALCILRRVLYSTRQRNINDILLTSSLRARQLNRMSEFSNCQPSALHTSHFAPSLSIPFGKAVPADDDLFPPIRPPADATTLQTDATPEEGEDAADADADADAATADGSDTSEESDEVSSSV